ncbi:MAG: hypothetical protein PHP54_04905 [Clostridia bacterium]|nr:hypothetical protein [Clostridia bacterium]
MKTKEANKEGISLIVLVITIIVVIILAAAVILTLNNNNPINNAKESTFKNNVDTYKTTLSLYISNKILEDDKFNISTIKIEDIPTIDADKFEIKGGELVIKETASNQEKEWATSLEICQYNELNDEIVQFENGVKGTEMEVVTSEDTIVTRCGRNLCPSFNPFSKYGITATNLDDGSLNLNGVFDSAIALDLSSVSLKLPGNNIYYLSKNSTVNGLYVQVNRMRLGTQIALGGTYDSYQKNTIQVNDYQVGDVIRPFLGFRPGVSFDNENISFQLELGNVYHPYEKYQGETYTIKSNTPTKIPLLDGCNTLFAENGTIKVKYIAKGNM